MNRIPANGDGRQSSRSPPRARRRQAPWPAPPLPAGSRTLPEMGQTVDRCVAGTCGETKRGESDDQDSQHHPPAYPKQREGASVLLPERRCHTEGLSLREPVEPVRQQVVHEEAHEDVVEQAALQSARRGGDDVLLLPAHMAPSPQPPHQVKLVPTLGEPEVIARECGAPEGDVGGTDIKHESGERVDLGYQSEEQYRISLGPPGGILIAARTGNRDYPL